MTIAITQRSATIALMSGFGRRQSDRFWAAKVERQTSLGTRWCRQVKISARITRRSITFQVAGVNATRLVRRGSEADRPVANINCGIAGANGAVMTGEPPKIGLAARGVLCPVGVGPGPRSVSEPNKSSERPALDVLAT